MAEELDMLEDAEFENQMTEMGEDQPRLLRFIATQQFTTSKVLVDHGRRIKKLEGRNNKIMGIIGGAGAVIATTFIETLNYFMRRPSG